MWQEYPIASRRRASALTRVRSAEPCRTANSPEPRSPVPIRASARCSALPGRSLRSARSPRPASRPCRRRRSPVAHRSSRADGLTPAGHVVAGMARAAGATRLRGAIEQSRRCRACLRVRWCDEPLAREPHAETQRVTLPARRGATAAILDEITAADSGDDRRILFSRQPQVSLPATWSSAPSASLTFASRMNHDGINQFRSGAERPPRRRQGQPLRPQHAGLDARPRCARPQHRADGALHPRGRGERPAAQQGQQVARDRAPADRGRRDRRLLHHHRRGRGDGGGRHRQHPDHVADRLAADDRPAARPQRIVRRADRRRRRCPQRRRAVGGDRLTASRSASSSRSMSGRDEPGSSARTMWSH